MFQQQLSLVFAFFRSVDNGGVRIFKQFIKLFSAFIFAFASLLIRREIDCNLVLSALKVNLFLLDPKDFYLANSEVRGLKKNLDSINVMNVARYQFQKLSI